MSLFEKIFGVKIEPVPWESGPSIYGHIRGLLADGVTDFSRGDNRLPDDERQQKGRELRFAHGALDGLMGAPLPDDEHSVVTHASNLIINYCKSPSTKNKLAIYQFARDNQFVRLIDQLLEELNTKKLDLRRLHDLAHSFAVQGADREPVKLGIALLGCMGKPDDKGIFELLGRHDEFSLYCCVALGNYPDGEELIWLLAQRVSNWGRIHAVRCLIHTENHEIKNWLLRDGFRNGVMNEYLAYECAVAGDLQLALCADEVDAELLTAAGEIILALIQGGPAENMDDYAEGAEVVERIVELTVPRASTLDDFIFANRIKDYLSRDSAAWEARSTRGWTDERRTKIHQMCESITSCSQWRELALEQLETSDNTSFRKAIEVAEALCVDTWPFHWKRLEAEPTDSGRWYFAMQAKDHIRIEQVIGLATRVLPLDKIGSGPKSVTGIGKEYEPHRCLDYVVQELSGFPGRGWDLIQVAMRGESIRLRAMALRALQEWKIENWPSGALAELKTMLSREPDQKMRERIDKVIACHSPSGEIET